MFAKPLAAALVAATVAVVGSSAPASAATVAASSDSRSVDVRHDDLDLASPAGIAKLERRVKFAVRSVCGPLNARDIAESGRVMACRKEAAGAARTRVEVAIASARSDSRLARNEAAPSVQGAAN